MININFTNGKDKAGKIMLDHGSFLYKLALAVTSGLCLYFIVGFINDWKADRVEDKKFKEKLITAIHWVPIDSVDHVEMKYSLICLKNSEDSTWNVVAKRLKSYGIKITE